MTPSTEGRYNSLGAITLEVGAGRALNAELKNLLVESGFDSEFKWSDFSSAKHRFAPEKMIDFVLRSLRQLRIAACVLMIRESELISGSTNRNTRRIELPSGQDLSRP